MAQEIKQPQDFLKSLYDQYPPNKFNILFPSETLLQISPLQQVNYEILHINPDPVKQDVFSVGKTEIDGKWVEKFALTKVALERIAHSAGVQVDHADSGYVPTGNPRSAGYKIVGAVQKPDGTWLRLTKSKFVDLDAIVEKTRFKYQGLLESGKLTVGYGNKQRTLQNDAEGQKYIEGKVKEEEIRVMEFKEALAETKAYTRLVRALLGLKSWYTADDLSKPFVVVKISLNINFMLADPQTKNMLVEHAIMSQNMMFGMPSRMLADAPKSMQLPASSQEISATVIDDEDENEEHIDSVEPIEQPKPQPPLTEIPLPELVETFQLAKDNERLDTLKKWIERKGYIAKPGNPPPEKLSLEMQVKFLKHLYSMPDKEVEF
jgi:hypothetical protein